MTDPPWTGGIVGRRTATHHPCDGGWLGGDQIQRHIMRRGPYRGHGGHHGSHPRPADHLGACCHRAGARRPSHGRGPASPGPRSQGAARAAQRNLEQGGGTVSVQVSAKISYRTVTDYRPGGSVQRERYARPAWRPPSRDVVTWTIGGSGADRRYQPMPRIPKPGAYPTLRKASWVRLKPPSTD